MRIRVGAICRNRDQVLLVEHEKEAQRYFLLPGGGVSRGEPTGEAVVREVLEETGIRVRPRRVVGICESIFPDRRRHIVHFIYETDYTGGQPGPSQDPRVRCSGFFPIALLNQLHLRPPLQQWLQRRLVEGFLDHPEYLGSLWAN